MSRIFSTNRYRIPTLTLVLSGTLAFGCSAQDADLSDTASTKQGATATANLNVVAGSSKIINTYAPLAADASAGATSVSVSPGSLSELNLAAGDLLMLYQPQGAQIATTDDSGYGAVSTLGGAGLYEVFRINGSDPKTGQIQLAKGCTLRNAYTTTGKTQAIRVPRFKQVTVEGGLNAVPDAVLTAAPWNGSTGGILALRADTISVDGEIDVSGTGFRGGKPNAGSAVIATDQVEFRSSTATTGGEKGESIAGAQADYDNLAGRFGRGAPANGGGGGNNTNAGGGGGANAGDLAAYTGDGVMGNTQQFAAAWALDPAFIAKGGFTASSGGGRGSYTLSGNAQNPTLVGPGDPTWGGNNRREHGGRGGHPLLPDATSRVFFGGGGGGGDANDNVGGAGGAGGGIALLLSKVVTSMTGGCITSAGASGGSSQIDGAGGGGGGGSIVMSASHINGVNVTAFGGKGGNSDAPIATINGTGGGGGGGFVSAPMGAAFAPELGGGPAGTTNSTSATAFNVNGATDGSAGVNKPFTGDLPVCLPADLSVTYTATPPLVRVNTPIRCSVQVQNAGPEDAESLKLSISIPASTTVATEPEGSGWTCTRATDIYNCTLPSLAANAQSSLRFFLAAQPSAADTLQSTAKVSADNAEPNPNNNAASITVTLDRTEVRGDGFTCQAAGPGAATGREGATALALLMGIGVALRVRRRRAPFFAELTN